MAKPARKHYLPDSPFNVAREAVPPDELYAEGDRVAHDRHGLGRVVTVYGADSLEVDFGTGRRLVSIPTTKMHKL